MHMRSTLDWSQSNNISCVCFVVSAKHCNFIRATAARLSHHNSVRLSDGWISPKECKLGSLILHRRLPGKL